MKKKIFYSICCLSVLLSVTKAEAQISGQVPFKSVTPPESGIEKSASKVSTDLGNLYKKQLLKINGSVAKSKPVGASEGLEKYIQIRGDKVVIDVTVEEDSRKVRAELEKIGFKIFAAYGRVISGTIPIEGISKLEAVSEIRFAQPAYKPMHGPASLKKLSEEGLQKSSVSSVVPVISQGDTAQRSYIARNKYKVNGKGVKIGILSDSYNDLGTAATGVKNGELPGKDNPFGFKTPVKVFEDYGSGGTDEGRAMAEIVHDVAPGAEIGFHTAFNGQADFAQGIIDMANAGYKVINDDIYYYAEPFYQDGIIAQAVDAAKKKGVTYFSSAGNQAHQSYESSFRPSNYAPLGAKFGTAHNFSATPDAPVYFQPVTIPSSGYVIFDLQWDDPFFSAGGAGAKTDLDIYLVDADGRNLNFSAASNIGRDPLELFDFYNNTNSTQFYLVITKFAGPDPKHVKYIYFGDASFSSNAHSVPGINAPTLVGHAKAEGAIATGAAWWKFTPAYLSDTPRIEEFSSVGGVSNFFDVQGNRISPLKRKKPEITAPDGGNTSFFGYDLSVSDTDTFPNFFGTSAAAPHAAGVAALMIEAQKLKTITPDQIKGVLQEKAFDMNDRYTRGFDEGFDYNTGYGFIHADKAVGAVKYPAIYVKNLQVEPVCSEDPATTRKWKIINPNSFAIEAHWLLSGFNQEGSFTVPPGEKTFSTNTAYYKGFPVPNIVIADWKDNLNASHIDVAYSTSAKCGQEIVSASNSDQKLRAIGDVKTTGKPMTAEVYPNPSTKNFRVYLALDNRQNSNLTLYTADGRLLYQKTGQANGVVDIDATSYKPGLYILKVRQGQFNKTFKLVKQ